MEKLDEIDVIIVTYQSEKWILNCLRTLASSSYPCKLLKIVIVDNNSSDLTLSIVENFSENSIFGAFKIIRNESNKGFAAANNIGLKNSYSPLIILLNVDTEIDKDAINLAHRKYKVSSEKVALWEMRQVPFEHPKFYDPVTLKTSWSSAACVLIKRAAIEQVNGFDETLFMYAEDVDLSWRLRHAGFELLYLPKSIVKHYTYEQGMVVKPLQLNYSLRNNLRMRKRYGTIMDFLRGSAIVSLYAFIGNNRNKLHKTKLFFSIPQVWLAETRRKWNISPIFNRFEYELNREGAYYHTNIEFSSDMPLVSVLIRSIGRMEMLLNALQCLSNQTYLNLEIVLVEDGSERASEVNSLFPDLKIQYISIIKSGRVEAANVAMKLANGAYFCFLDEDDLLFADHIEALIGSLIKHPSYKAAYSLAYETSSYPSYAALDKSCFKTIYNFAFNRYMLYHYNYLPIQSVLFSRDLYDQYGGMDLNMHVLEDWDLWLKYSTNHDFLYVPKTTSIYKVSKDERTFVERLIEFKKMEIILKSKHSNYLKNLSKEEIQIGKKIERKHSSLRKKLMLYGFPEFVKRAKMRVCIKKRRGSFHE